MQRRHVHTDKRNKNSCKKSKRPTVDITKGIVAQGGLRGWPYHPTRGWRKSNSFVPEKPVVVEEKTTEDEVFE